MDNEIKRSADGQTSSNSLRMRETAGKSKIHRASVRGRRECTHKTKCQEYSRCTMRGDDQRMQSWWRRRSLTSRHPVSRLLESRGARKSMRHVREGQDATQPLQQTSAAPSWARKHTDAMAHAVHWSEVSAQWCGAASQRARASERTGARVVARNRARTRVGLVPLGSSTVRKGRAPSSRSRQQSTRVRGGRCATTRSAETLLQVEPV